MAKQKLKVPLKRAADPDLDPDGPPRAAGSDGKRKVKTLRKGKLKAGPGAAVVKSASPVRKRLIKAKRKPKGVAAALGSTAAGLVKRLADVGSLVPAAPRPRKARPGPALGRLERLEIAIGEVRIGGRVSPRTRKLLGSGVHKMAQKVIEEAAEAAIEAIRGDHAAFVNESVDLFYNLLALGSELGVPLAAIWAEMDRRETTLGMAEKLPKSPEV